MRSYWPAIIVSFIGHGVLVFLAVWGWEATYKKTEVKKPSYIKASLVELKPKVKPKTEVKNIPAPKPKPKPKPKKDDSKKRDLEKKKQQQLAEKKRREAEQKRKNQLAKKKAEEARKLKEKKERERKERERRAAEEKRREQAQKQQEELERQALAKALAAEKAQLEAERQAAEDAATVESYSALIADKVERNWSRPPSARNGMQVTLRIHLVPTGQVVGVSVLKSSGDSIFDDKAVRAVKKAERFPELQALPSRIFEQQFRVFKFEFSPEDLRQ